MSGHPAPSSRSLLARLAPARGGDESGFAMVTVLGTMVVLSLMVGLATMSASRALSDARGNQSFRAAGAAAEAGVDDYLSHLNLDSDYYQRANRDVVDPTNGAMTSTAGVAVPGTTNGATFTYRVLSTAAEVVANGSLVLESTGRAGKVARTVRVTLARKSFLDYLWYTDYETLDPLNTANPSGYAHCAVYEWAGRPSTCDPVRLVWRTSDDMHGPVHSNDTMLMYGNPTFRSTFDTGWQDPARVYWKRFDTVTPTAPNFTVPPVSQPVAMPPTNNRLRDQAAAGNGCLYTGPTRIVFNNASGSSPGTMTVTSPFTTRSSYACGTFSAPGYSATVNVPDGGVIYVDPGPSGCATTLSSWISVVGFPISGDDSHTGVTPLLGYACTNGDAFVEGTVKGRVTVGTANNVVITHHLLYSSGTTGTDVLGLAANNFVQLYRPVTCNSTSTWRESGTNRCLGGTDVPVGGRYPWLDPQVNAAILSTSHAFFLQCYFCGGNGTSTTPRSLGTLTVRGGIAQRFRGPVSATTATGACSNGLCGYAKNYVYDARLRFSPPPFLADLAETRWGVQYFAEGAG